MIDFKNFNWEAFGSNFGIVIMCAVFLGLIGLFAFLLISVLWWASPWFLFGAALFLIVCGITAAFITDYEVKNGKL